MNLVWTKFAIIVSCTLAGTKTHYNSEREWWELGWSFDLAPTEPGAEATCSLPCTVVGAHLLPRHLVAPFALALSAWACTALPTLILRGSNQAQGVRACLWPLLLLQLHLILARLAFPHNPVWAYAWALHASAGVLSGWAPPRRALAFQALQPWLAGAGVALICLFAWNTGAPAGLVRWRTGAYSQCGWAAHLVAGVGVDVLTGILGPLGSLVIGSRSCA